VAVKYTYSNNLPVQGRDTLEMSEVSDCPYLPLFTSMLNAIGFEGLCCIDYKVFDNRPFVLEINPRMGGSLSLYFHRFVEEVA
jgi:predicted ATP-grasp superfamily ATP-dependent carboligase